MGRKTYSMISDPTDHVIRKWRELNADLAKHFNRIQSDALHVITSRACLRTAPLFVEAFDFHGDFESLASNDLTHFFWSCEATLCAGLWPEIGKIYADNAHQENGGNFSESYKFFKFDPAQLAARDAVRIASYPTHSEKPDESTSLTAAGCIQQSLNEFDRFQSSHLSSDAKAAVYRDFEFVSVKNDRFLLSQVSLWYDGIPQPLFNNWNKLSSALIKLEKDWDVWTNWYQDRLKGGVPLIKTFELGDPENKQPGRITFPGWEYANAAIVNPKIRELLDLYDPPGAPTPQHEPNFEIGEADEINLGAEKSVNNTDWDRVNELHPILKMLMDNLQAALSGCENSHPALFQSVKIYSGLLNKPINELPFSALAGLGMAMANAEAANKRDINRIAPSLEDNAQTALNSVLDIHGAFIMASAAGRNLVTDAETFARTPQQSKSRSVDIEKLKETLQTADLADDEVVAVIRSAADVDAQGEQPERGTIYANNVVRNITSVVTNGAMASMIGGLMATGVGPLMGLGGRVGSRLLAGF